MPDVVIVGAGVIGCAAAEALTLRGAVVHVVDARGLGTGATQASAGMLAPYTEGRHDPWLEALGVRSLAAYDTLIHRLVPDSDEPPFVRAATLEVARDDQEARELYQQAADLRGRGVTCAFVSAGEAREREPAITPECAGALHVEGHAYARVTELTTSLWRTAEGRGARMTEGDVRRIERDAAGGLSVVLGGGQDPLHARHVVLAAGSWASRIEIDSLPAIPVRPIRGQLLQLAWNGPPLSHMIGGTRCYTLTWHDGTMLAGATVEDVGFDDRATAGAVRDMLHALCELVPSAAEAGFTRVRVGFRPVTPDRRPIIGPSQRVPGLVYATGHYRNGVLLAPVTGELVAKAVTGEDDPAFDATGAGRFGDY